MDTTRVFGLPFRDPTLFAIVGLALSIILPPLATTIASLMSSNSFVTTHVPWILAGAGVVAFTLIAVLNMPRQAAARIQIAARRHSDRRVLEALCASVRAMLEHACGDGGRPSCTTPRMTKHWHRDFELRRARGLAQRTEALLHASGRHFNTGDWALEALLDTTIPTLEGRMLTRIGLHFRNHLNSSAERTAAAVDQCAGDLLAHLDLVERHAECCADGIRTVLLERSTGLALENSAQILSRAIEQGLPVKDALKLVGKVIRGRHGAPLDELLHPDLLRATPDTARIVRWLQFMHEALDDQRTETCNTAKTVLKEMFSTGRSIVVTTGYSRMAARVLRDLADDGERFTVILVRADTHDPALQRETVLEQRLMKQELYLSKKLHGRVTRSGARRLHMAQLPLSESGLLIVGAGAVDTRATLLQPRGGRALHDAIGQLVRPTNSLPINWTRVAVCEPYKILPPQVLAEAAGARLLTTCGLGREYDALVCGRDVVKRVQANGDGQSSLSDQRNRWRSAIWKELSAGTSTLPHEVLPIVPAP